MGNLLEQSVLLETNDCFSYGCAAAIQLLADNVLADLLAWFQIKLQNGPLEPVVYLPERTLSKIVYVMCRVERC